MRDTQLLPLRIAAFVAEALGLEDDPRAIAPNVVFMKEDVHSGVAALELETSIGPAPFLIYYYELAGQLEGGLSGAEQFRADIATLERATELNTPGPRIVASITTDQEGYILATSPAIFRAMTGIGEADALEATEADLLPGPETVAARRQAASDLLGLLRDANAAAARWLAAVRATNRMPEAPLPGAIEAGAEEAALALFVIDQESIADLLSALNLIVASANEQAEARHGRSSDDPDDESR